jgi:hypothetical protein
VYHCRFVCRLRFLLAYTYALILKGESAQKGLSVLEEGRIYHQPLYYSHGTKCKHYQDIVNDLVDYFNRQIVAGKYRAPCIVNMDETNLDFDVTPRKMLESIGLWTVSGYKVDHAACASVVLAVSMSGVKLPAMVIFKGA